MRELQPRPEIIEKFFRKDCAATARVIIKLALLCVRFGRAAALVRRSVGAPTAHACPGNGSDHSEDIRAG